MTNMTSNLMKICSAIPRLLYSNIRTARYVEANDTLLLLQLSTAKAPQGTNNTDRYSIASNSVSVSLTLVVEPADGPSDKRFQTQYSGGQFKILTFDIDYRRLGRQTNVNNSLQAGTIHVTCHATGE
jgi:hypothetical protein